MLAGASGLDLAMLVVAADDSVMPQTREHLEILQLLGLEGGVIALTKCDLVDSSWLGLVEDDIRELVRGTFLEHASIVPTSTITGQGIVQLKHELARLCKAVNIQKDTDLFRMAIDRSFTLAGHGTVVTGTVASGSVGIGDELEWQPIGRPVKVRGLQRHDQPVERIDRGSRCAINLTGVKHGDISRGHELAAPSYLRATQVLSVNVTGVREPVRSLRHRGRYRLHLGTAEVTATLALLDGSEVPSGEQKLGQLFVAEPVVAVYGQPFILRQESPPATLGGGHVVQTRAQRIRRKDKVTQSRLNRLLSTNDLERLTAALAFEGLSPWDDRRLASLTGLSVDRISSMGDELTKTGAVVNLPVSSHRSIRVLSEFVAHLEDRVFRAVARLHEARPRLGAIPLPYLAAELPDLGSDALIAGIVERLRSQGKVIVDANTVALKGYEPKLSQGRAHTQRQPAGDDSQGRREPARSERARRCGWYPRLCRSGASDPAVR